MRGNQYCECRLHLRLIAKADISNRWIKSNNLNLSKLHNKTRSTVLSHNYSQCIKNRVL